MKNNAADKKNENAQARSKAVGEKPQWTKPVLAIRRIKDITRGGSFSGTDGSMMMMMSSSDARLKTNIACIGRAPSGLSIYSFRYIWGGPVRIGGIAQEIARARPDAVSVGTDGYLRVDYSLIDIDPT
ncbi:MAG: tail fiber domain-containing protein [Alphaproteobacteria bacterium]|nr:tail fiber domain-containing protein [Alphaproteobacteria bacterium]MBM3654950.1 tail fiber domain-containing protein [Alphaproteobacteria bacterium]